MRSKIICILISIISIVITSTNVSAQDMQDLIVLRNGQYIECSVTYVADVVDGEYDDSYEIKFIKPAKKLFGQHNGHEWVDLGLSSGLKWATRNVGPSSPEEYGNYCA